VRRVCDFRYKHRCRVRCNCDSEANNETREEEDVISAGYGLEPGRCEHDEGAYPHCLSSAESVTEHGRKRKGTKGAEVLDEDV
jgi:hypothetical protein